MNQSGSERCRERWERKKEEGGGGGGYREGECKRERVRLSACVAERQTDRQTF